VLDARTLEWLQNSEETLLELGSFFCPWCEHYKEGWDSWMGHCQKVHCRKLEEGNFSRRLLLDAIQFEARVAVKLVGELQYECVCQSCQYNTHGCRAARMSYKQCRLKHARLAVEAEMEAEYER
jgi:hypothetical protein